MVSGVWSMGTSVSMGQNGGRKLANEFMNNIELQFLNYLEQILWPDGGSVE